MSHRPHPFTAAVALLAVAMASGAAHADAKKARALADRAKALYEVGKYAEALSSYQDAYVEKRDSSYLYNIGQCQRLIGKNAEALQTYRTYLQQAPKAKNRDEVEKIVKELESAPAGGTAAPPAPPPPPPGGAASPAHGPAPAMPQPVPPPPAPAGAAPPPAPPPPPSRSHETAPARAGAAGQDPDLESAKAEFEQGVRLYLKEQYDAAAGKYLAAYDRKPFPAFLYNAAVAFEKGKRLDLARQYYEKYVDKDPDAKDAADVRARIEAIKNILNPATPQKDKIKLSAIDTKGLVVIDTKPPGATIYFADKTLGPAGRTPWQGSLASTPVKLIVESQGFKPEERELQPRSDKLLDVYIALSQEHYLGWVEIVSNVVGADVFVDRTDIGALGRTPFTGHLKPGLHKVTVGKNGYVSVEKEVDVQPGTASQFRIDLDRVVNGWINVVGRHTKGGRLVVNEKFACNTPCRWEGLPGKYRVRVEHPQMEAFKADIEIERSTDTSINVQFSPKPGRGKAITATVFSALFLGGGIYLGKLGSDDKAALAAEIKGNRSIDTNDPRVSSGKLKYLIADGLFGLSLLSAVLATIGYVSSGDDSVGFIDMKTVGLAPSVGPDGAGLGATWRF